MAGEDIAREGVEFRVEIALPDGCSAAEVQMLVDELAFLRPVLDDDRGRIRLSVKAPSRAEAEAYALRRVTTALRSVAKGRRPAGRGE